MSANKRPPRPLSFRAARVQPGSILRLLIFAALAIAGAAWALLRHWTLVEPPLRVPVPAPTYDADAGELPAPEIVE